MSSRSTLRDVAELAGVNPSTVSRTLNLDPALNISGDTRARILEAARQLDYRPNATARRLRMARSMAIGYFIPDLVNPANGPLVAGVQRRAREAGYTVLIGSSADSIGVAESFQQLLGEGRVDGLLVNCGVLTDDAVLALASSSAPVALVNRSVEGARASVVMDDQAAAQAAAKHLIHLGHRRLMHLTGPQYADTTRRRAEGFRLGAGRRCEIVTVHARDWSDVAGHETALEALANESAATAVFADNVSLAIGTVAAAGRLGISVPTDLSVIAMHDVPLASHVLPALTAVRTPLAEMGAASVDVLRTMLEGSTPDPLTIVRDPAPFVIERGSTAPPATETQTRRRPSR